MAIQIKFDNNHNAIEPVFVLGTRSGLRLGPIPAVNINISDNFNAAFDLSFSVYKYNNGEVYPYWDSLKDFKLVWCRDWDVWFEMSVEIDESDDTLKNIQCKSICESELSQIMLYDIEINTEADIDNDDYTRTVLYDPENPKGSLLNRIMEKAPHYSIAHVDSSIANIQRSFSFNNTSLYDAFNDIAEEIDCLFVFDSGTDANGKIERSISVYDLETYCTECGSRFEYQPGGVCPKCGSTNVLKGYGNDTNIYVSVENLAGSVTFSTDTGSVKNCFKLEAGDDLMTATIRNSNPNGSAYIWNISEDTRADMSPELSEKLEDYDELYAYYQSEYEVSVPSNLRTQYNILVNKYSEYSDDIQPMPSPLVGYPALMDAYYDTIDFYLLLHDTLMPSVEIDNISADTEAAKLTAANLSPVSVQNLENLSATTAGNAVLSMAKAIVNPNFQVKLNTSAYNAPVWTGNFTVTNYSNADDTATSLIINITLNDDYENFVRQKIDKALNTKIYTTDAVSITTLFKLPLVDFIAELKKYNLVSLQTFADAARACIDILIEQGISDGETWADSTPNMYEDLYIPYYEKMMSVQTELILRESEVDLIAGKYDVQGGLLADGMQTVLLSEKQNIQDALDFEEYVGETLWHEFAAYRREDTYSNTNYISDGLNNAEIFAKAAEFLNVAQNEIYKSANLQHSITANLNNLLTMEEFESITDNFAVGNWIHVCVDEKVYGLRLLSYTLNFDDLSGLSVTFSDVKAYRDGITDSQSVIAQAASMASSYDHVSRQAKKGDKGNSQLIDWVENGLALTTMKIVNSSDNQSIELDEHGLLCREYITETGTYSDKQLKIINHGLYITDDGWLTSKTGVGNFEYYNPMTEQVEEAYGVIAETLVGNLILGETVGIFNETGSVTMDKNGLVITSDNRYEDDNDVHFTLQKKTYDEDGNEVIQQVAYFDSNGEFVLNGSVLIHDEESPNVSSIADLCDTSRYQQMMEERLVQERFTTETTIDEKASAVAAEADYYLNEYKNMLSQYVRIDSRGLVLGSDDELATSETVIDNNGVWFYNENFRVAYINHDQLYIPKAVIESTLKLGNFTFITRPSNGSVSLVWHDPES